MATYNVNMRQYNGTSFDDVLPLAYNSQLFDNKTYSDVSASIYQLARADIDDLLYIGFGSYVGTGYNSVSINFPDECVMFGLFGIGPANTTTSTSETTVLAGCSFCSMDNLSTDTAQILSIQYGANLWSNINIRKLPTNTGVLWSIDDFDSVEQCLNTSGTTYRYVYVCKKVNSVAALFISNGVFTVPVTGKYNIELHGVGGTSRKYTLASKYGAATGGGSGQLYENVQLTAGDTYNVVVGRYNTDNTSSSFGDYTVAAGGNATSTTSSAEAGKASGNIASAGTSVKGERSENFGDISGGSGGGIFGKFYGSGGGAEATYNSNASLWSYSTLRPNNGCVYIYQTS